MSTAEAWYRQTWPWVLILIPFTAVLFGIFMIVVATTNPDDLVADDYYKEGMAINRELKMDTKAKEMAVVAVLDLARGNQGFLLEGANDSAVVLNVYHVTDSEKDLQVLLTPGESNDYSIPEEVLSLLAEQGIWYLELEGTDNAWRLRTRVVTPVAKVEMRAR